MSAPPRRRPPYPLGIRIRLDRHTQVLRPDPDDAVPVSSAVRVLGGDPPGLISVAAQAASHLHSADFTVRDALTASLARVLTDRGMAHPDPQPVCTAASPGNDLGQVSVVVPVRDDETGLRTLLATLEPERRRGLVVIVVDDGSADELRATRLDPEAVRCGVGAVRVLRLSRSLGPAAARNRGARAAVADGAQVVVFLDADTEPRPGWLDPLLRHLDDPAVCAVAPRIVAADPGRLWVRGFETARSALDMGPWPGAVRPRTRVPYVPSAALVVRPDRLPAPPPGGGDGPFDERMRVAEDVDLCWRVDAAGGLIRYEPGVRIGHRHRTDLGAMLRRRSFYGTGAAPLAVRHPGDVAPAIFSPWSLAVASGMWSGTVVGAVLAGFSGARAWRRTRSLVGDDAAAARMVARGALGAVRQLPSALLRPYWPLTALVLLLTARPRGPLARFLRSRLVAAALLEGLWHWWDCREPGRLPVDDPLGHLALHRLDDLAYGVGVWRSALTARSPRALIPRWRR